MTYFPEIFNTYGFDTEPEAERKANKPMNERRADAIAVIKKLKGWKSDSWHLMPVLWLEEKANELREAADAARANAA